MVDDAGFSLVEVAWCLFFRIVNQVLVRLWARCLEGYPRERVPSSHVLAQAGVWGSRSLTGRGLVMGNHGWVQPSDRRHMCSEAFYGFAGCDAGEFIVCKLSFERCVRPVSLGELRCDLHRRGVDGSCT